MDLPGQLAIDPDDTNDSIQCGMHLLRSSVTLTVALDLLERMLCRNLGHGRPQIGRSTILTSIRCETIRAINSYSIGSIKVKAMKS